MLKIVAGTPLATYAVMPVSDRRQSPRLSLSRDVNEQRVRVSGPFRLLDIGTGGFAASATIEVPIGAEQRFEFVIGPVAVTLPASAVRRQRVPGSLTKYIAGFVFAQQAANRERIDLLLSIIADALAGDPPASAWAT